MPPVTEEFAAVWEIYEESRRPSCAGPGPHALGSRRWFQLMGLSPGHLVSPRHFCSYRRAVARLEARPARPDSWDARRVRLFDGLRVPTEYRGEMEQPAR